ncbi:MAG: DNA/RNA nuclease SfsA [Planctomycetales bacterium]|nr:DNA/RNA nuclease SfsA [bacterium]UNM07751.1 MAG: DNA/RNA nuclease SfsA [Planctomycetales bacterium]
MKANGLIEATLLRRYKRFLADVRMPDGTEQTVHVPNTGSLLGCIREESPCLLLDHGEGKRQFRHSLFMVRPGRNWICVDTGLPNRMVAEAARAQKIEALSGYREYITEVPYGTGSRIDLLCRVHEKDMLQRCWVEVKATTLVNGNVAMFPDAVTARGTKHLMELARVVEQGERAVQLYFIQRKDCELFQPADHIDPAYGRALRQAHTAGVELIALRSEPSKQGIKIGRPIPVEL